MQKNINGVLINFEYIKKSETTIVFLHGWGGSIESFRLYQNYFLSATNFSLLNIDLPPFNKSEEPPPTFTIYSYYNLILSLLNSLNIKSVHLVGHSFGGRIALLLASFNNKLVKSLTLISAAGIKPRKSLKLRFKILFYKLKKRLLKKHKFNIKKVGSKDYQALSPNMKKVFVSIVNEDLAKHLDKIIAPTLIVWDKSDKETPFYMAKKFKRKIKDSEIILFKGGGHFCYIYNSTKLLKILSVFYNKLEDK